MTLRDRKLSALRKLQQQRDAAQKTGDVVRSGRLFRQSMRLIAEIATLRKAVQS
jgi:hypothetical protein